MANLLIGDIHGCYDEFMRVLEKANFSSSDTLWLTGDLIARGPKSLEVLRFVKQNRAQIRLVLGNHDLHLLAIYAKISQFSKKETIQQILNAPDCDELMNWLRMQPLMQVDSKLKLIMVHAGISPQWDLATAQQCADDLHQILINPIYPYFLDKMYGDLPNEWSQTLQGMDRLRYIANAFTRMRYCHINGKLDMRCKDHPKKAPSSLKPWFMLPRQIPDEYSIAFGHWAALNGKGTPENIYALDTGCCWEGKLTCLRFEDKKYFKQRNLNVHLK